MASSSLNVPQQKLQSFAKGKSIAGSIKDQWPDDGFQYDRIGRNPSEDRTKSRDTNLPSAEAYKPLLDTVAFRPHDDEDEIFTQTFPHIYQRKRGGWNARIPEVDTKEEDTSRTSEKISSNAVDEAVTILLKLVWNLEQPRTERQKLILWQATEPFIRLRPTNSSETSKATRDNARPQSFANKWNHTGKTLSSTPIGVKAPRAHNADTDPNQAIINDPAQEPSNFELQRLAASGQNRANGEVSTSTGKGVASAAASSAKSSGPAEDPLLKSNDYSRAHDTDFDVASHVLWHHAKDRYMTIDKFLHEVGECRAHGVTDSEYGLAKRLMDRLRTVSEREFVGGRYLMPLTLRYDSQDLSKYSVDKTCIFFTFPYLYVGPRSLRKYKGTGGPEHPARTLLQSHYRLHKTKDRDDLQCIKWLKLGQHQSDVTETGKVSLKGTGIQKPKRLLSRLHQWSSPEKPKELFYVPQYWGLIVGLDNLITSSICGVEELRGTKIATPTTLVHENINTLSLVRILFYRESCLEELVFPLEQCDSFFGLLNKQQRILDLLELLEDEKKLAVEQRSGFVVTEQSVVEKPATSKNKVGSSLELYSLWRDEDGHKITLHNWASIISAARYKEMLTLRMQRDTPIIKMHPGRGKDQGDTSVPAETIGDNVSGISVTTPFLQWPVLDEFGEKDALSIDDRVKKFLRAIQLHLPVRNKMTVRERARRPQDASERRSQEQTVVEFKVITLKQLKGHTKNVFAKPATANSLIDTSKELLTLFISSELEEKLERECEAFKIFWGTVHHLLSKLQDEARLEGQLVNFIDALKVLIRGAGQIHVGVRRHQAVKVPAGNSSWQNESMLAEGTTLLSALVDALGSIFHMFVEAVRYSNSWADGKETSMLAPDSEVAKYLGETSRHLQNAKNQLIRVVNGEEKADTLAPVLTPEGIAISTMERLTSGMYKNKTLDIVGMYEECLEYLTLQVKYEASRRLLVKINEYTEEVNVVIDVLKQQRHVLLQFQTALDPKTFKAPSLARRLRFEYERTSLDKLRLAIKKQLDACSELRKRAKQLSVEDVQLVETLQDDNSKAIFIFTAVTVLFLPSSFVAGFFGMNLKHISDTSSDVTLFWKVSGPLTVGILLACTFLAIGGEDIYFGIARLWRRLKDLIRE